jgi:excisionase family DNA binding protein
MPKGTVKDANELPLVLTMHHVQEVLGCAKDVAYRLPHVKGFPSVRIGKSIRVPRDRFFAWLNAQAGAQEE